MFLVLVVMVVGGGGVEGRGAMFLDLGLSVELWVGLWVGLWMWVRLREGVDVRIDRYFIGLDVIQGVSHIHVSADHHIIGLGGNLTPPFIPILDLNLVKPISQIPSPNLTS